MFLAGHLDQHLEVYMHEFAAAVLAGEWKGLKEHMVTLLFPL